MSILLKLFHHFGSDTPTIIYGHSGRAYYMLDSTHFFIIMSKLLLFLLSPLSCYLFVSPILLFKSLLLDLVFRHHLFFVDFDNQLIRRYLFEHPFLIK